MAKIEGVLEYIHPIEHPSEKFSKIEFGLDCSAEFHGQVITNYIGMQVTNKNCDILAGFKEGDKVEVDYSLGSYNVGKDAKKGNRPIIYNNVTCTRIRLIEAGKSAGTGLAGGVAAPVIDPNRPPAPDGWVYDEKGTLVKMPF